MAIEASQPFDMAYAVSEDPRDPLPRTDIEEWRAQFNAWVEDGNDWRHPPQPIR